MLKTVPRLVFVLRRDFLFAVALAVAALALGLLVNRFREAPLPARYLSKGIRLEDAVVALNETSTKPAEIRYILPVELRDLLARNSAVILDSRPEALFARGHIPGALPLPREAFRTFYERHRLETDKTRQFVVYCQSDECEDSELVARALTKLGFHNVSVLAGGWDGWQEHTP
jgi:rhodanese-related sulfurtransferase